MPQPRESELLYAGPLDWLTLEKVDGLSLPEGSEPATRKDFSFNSEESAIVARVKGFGEPEFHFTARLIPAIGNGLPLPKNLRAENMDHFIRAQGKLWELLEQGIDLADIPEGLALLEELRGLLR